MNFFAHSLSFVLVPINTVYAFAIEWIEFITDCIYKCTFAIRAQEMSIHTFYTAINRHDFTVFIRNEANSIFKVITFITISAFSCLIVPFFTKITDLGAIAIWSQIISENAFFTSSIVIRFRAVCFLNGILIKIILNQTASIYLLIPSITTCTETIISPILAEITYFETFIID